MEERLLTPEEVAEKLRVARRTVYTWLHEGRLRGRKAGRWWRIRPEDVELFLEGNGGQENSSPQLPL